MVTTDNDPQPAGNGTLTATQNRLIALLTYIEQVEKLNRKPAFSVPTEFFRAYETELRGLPGVEFDLQEEGVEIWAKIERLKESEPPAPEDSLKPWIQLSRSVEKTPVLHDQIPGAEKDDPPRRRSDYPTVEQQFTAYVDGPWAGWVSVERPRRQTIGVYNKLFTVLQALEAEGAEMPLEMVWGIGQAIWKHPSGRTLSYPLLTQLVELSLDTKSLALQVRTRQRPPALESDAFAALEVPGIVQLESAWRKYKEAADLTLSPFDPNSYTAILRTSVALLDSAGRYWPEVKGDADDRQLPGPTDQLTVTDTWVLFARRRSQNFLVEDLERLKGNLEAAGKMPGGPAALVTPPPDVVIDKLEVAFRGVSYGARTGSDGASPKELFFPKPYNVEQVQIVEKLETSTGVVVQGPPGTGKTHTIANVICHYLANGKKVLVTSKGEPALSVLQQQIPESVRALTVALLTDEKDGMRQFEHAVQEIASKVARINPNEIDREVDRLAARVNELHVKLSAIDHEVEQRASLQLKKLKFQGREILPDELAKYVVDNRDHFSWFPDKLAGKMPERRFSTADIESLRKARLVLGPDLGYLDCDLPVADSLVDGQTMLALHEDLLRSREMAVQMASGGIPPLLDATAEVTDKARQLFAFVKEAMGLAERLYSAPWRFTASLHQELRRKGWAALSTIEGVLGEVLTLEKKRKEFVQKPVEITAGAELIEEVLEAISRATQGKNPLGMWPFGKAEVKTVIQAVKVSGLPPQSADEWRHVEAFLAFRRDIRVTVTKWNGAASEVGLSAVSEYVPETVRELSKQVDHIYQIRRFASDHEQKVSGLVGQVLGEGWRFDASSPAVDNLKRLHQILAQHLDRTRLAYASSKLSDVIAKLAGRQGLVVDGMREFLTTEVGSTAVSAPQIGSRWAEFVAELRRLGGQKQALNEVERVATLIEEAGAPNWAKALRSHKAVDGADALTPTDWLEAWNWRAAATFLEAADSRNVLSKLHNARKTTESDLARTYQQLVEQKTWIAVYRNSPPAVKAALQAYLNAVKRIGKGTGIRAVRYRKEARAAMLDAYRAVPCWIMPQWRVSETLPAEIGKFDLVIVDEASQSDLWALPCLLRGDKLMVVGDDKQVSPEGVGLAETSIRDLKNRFLSDQVHADQMTPEKSLYDLAKVAFAGEFVMLKEHFRSVAPIIEFSKREFYNHELKPLRMPKQSERIDPPLVDVFVKGGVRNAEDENDAEAQAILQEIQSIIADSRFAGRTIGVVSLIGIKQAHRIKDLVDRELPAEEIIKRKMMFGDARIFQGNERDIILLSMVATPGRNIAFTRATFEQRFNVAASRARDRMYLFRSIPREGLSESDLKARLIDHFHQPFHQDLQKVADARELCESGFEREMYDELTSRQFRVRPQVKVGGYSIDLVVEGDHDRRLAVECDGDQYHGPERWGSDMARQRILERAGWTFWRCFGSSFTLNKKAVLDELCATLNQMGIEPSREAPVGTSSYTEYREVDPFETEEQVEEIIGDGGRDPSPTPVAVAEAPIPPAGPQKQPGAVGFSDAALAAFLNAHGGKSEDFRSKKGALWVVGANGAEATRQLRAWGFQHKPDRGWWKK